MRHSGLKRPISFIRQWTPDQGRLSPQEYAIKNELPQREAKAKRKAKAARRRKRRLAEEKTATHLLASNRAAEPATCQNTHPREGSGGFDSTLEKPTNNLVVESTADLVFTELLAVNNAAIASVMSAYGCQLHPEVIHFAIHDAVDRWRREFAPKTYFIGRFRKTS